MDLIRGLMWLVVVVCLTALLKSSAVGCVQTETYSEYRRNSRFEVIRELLSEFSLMSVMKWIFDLAVGDSWLSAILRLVFFGFLPVPIVKFIIWQQGYRSVGIARHSHAAKIMKQRRGYIRRDSLYALAQSIGSNGLGNVRLTAVFILGASFYLMLVGFYRNPILAFSAFMVFFGWFVGNFPPLSNTQYRKLSSYCVVIGIWGFCAWMMQTGRAQRLAKLAGIM